MGNPDRGLEEVNFVRSRPPPLVRQPWRLWLAGMRLAKLRAHESHPLYPAVPPRPAAGISAPALARLARAGLLPSYRRTFRLWFAAASSGWHLDACGVGRREHRRGADDPRTDGALSASADHRHLHDPDRLGAHPGAVRRQRAALLSAL